MGVARMWACHLSGCGMDVGVVKRHTCSPIFSLQTYLIHCNAFLSELLLSSFCPKLNPIISAVCTTLFILLILLEILPEKSGSPCSFTQYPPTLVSPTQYALLIVLLKSMH